MPEGSAWRSRRAACPPTRPTWSWSRPASWPGAPATCPGPASGSARASRSRPASAGQRRRGRRPDRPRPAVGACTCPRSTSTPWPPRSARRALLHRRRVGGGHRPRRQDPRGAEQGQHLVGRRHRPRAAGHRGRLRPLDELGLATLEDRWPDDLLAALAAGDPERLAEALHNDLEPAAFDLLPGLAKSKQRLLDASALGAIAGGSGPTMLGLAATRTTPPRWPGPSAPASPHRGSQGPVPGVTFGQPRGQPWRVV